MDHVDWLEQGDIDILCAALRDQVKVMLSSQMFLVNFKKWICFVEREMPCFLIT
jgi:hypothetical protein